MSEDFEEWFYRARHLLALDVIQEDEKSLFILWYKRGYTVSCAVKQYELIRKDS